MHFENILLIMLVFSYIQILHFIGQTTIVTMRACNCLNVVVESEGDFTEIDVDSLNLNEDERKDLFFNQVNFFV